MLLNNNHNETTCQCHFLSFNAIADIRVLSPYQLIISRLVILKYTEFIELIH